MEFHYIKIIKQRDDIMKNDAYLNFKKQKDFFNKGFTLNIDFRIKMLKKLKSSIQKYEDDVYISLEGDLGKSKFESFTTEISSVYSEIDFHIKNLKKWSRDKLVKTPLFLFPSKSRIHYEPYGCVLIIVPWNYPFQLALIPLIGAISAGNTALIKMSEFTENVSHTIKHIIKDAFSDDYIKVVNGGIDETTEILKQPYNMIFFTGSPKVGKIIMEAASKNLTPVILELGGKSPVIVDKSADLKLSARKILFGKLLNLSQTCVAPDYIIIEKSVKDEFLNYVVITLKEFFEDCDMTNPDTYKSMSHIINESNFKRIKSLIANENIIYGGYFFDDILKISPTLIDCGNVSEYVNGKIKSPVLREEIFGPVLPVLTYSNIEDTIEYINSDEKPLALYLFTKDSNMEKNIINKVSYGGGCINDTVVHLSNVNLPFGGVGHSGMGSYHGKYSYEAFSHKKSILKSPLWFDLKVKYLPYTDKKFNLIKKFLK